MMNQSNKIKNLILASLLIVSLVAFNFHSFSVLAEEDGSGTNDVPAEETTTQDTTQENTTTIETGDINSITEAENTVNTNVISQDSEEATSTPENATTSETIIPEATGTPIDGCNDCAPCDCVQCDCTTEITDENEAKVENDIDSEASTGDNQAENNHGNAIIKTGDINLVVGLVNNVNTNIIDSNFYQFLFNIFSQEGDINFSNEFAVSSQNENTCSSSTECLNIVNNNEGEIENNILIDASTGNNSLTGDGGALINTGDANVSASIFNSLNTNIIGSNWTHLIINVFGDWAGDLVLPGKETMQNFIMNGTLNISSGVPLAINRGSLSCGNHCGGSDIFNSNDGEIKNNVYTIARTGNNTASGNSSSVISTGDANTKTNLLNIANSNIVGGSQFFIAINNFGTWKGNIFSLPPGLGINGGPDNIKIYSFSPGDLNNALSNKSLNIKNNNSGSIENNILIDVSTGDNSASSNDGSAVINTGNANVSTDIFNILNSNIVDNNWFLGTINIFGSWEGDLSFGKPDLWIGISAEPSESDPRPGDSITYTLTYKNNGDADATGVTITDNYDEEHFRVSNSGSGRNLNNPGEVRWDIGTVPAGESGSVSYTGTIDNLSQGENIYLSNNSQIESSEKDGNYDDNSDTILVQVSGPAVLFYPPQPYDPNLKITKTNNTNGSVEAGNEVGYKIVIYNDSSGSAYNVTVWDTLINNSSHKVFSNQNWKLGTVFPYEEIVIDYTVAIGSEVPTGFYKNTVVAEVQDWTNHILAQLPEASNVIEVIAPEEPEEETPEENIIEEKENIEETSPDFAEIGNNLNDIESKIEKMREEIDRRIKEIPPAEAPTTPAESIVSPFSRLLIPRVLAQEKSVLLEEEPKIEKEGPEKYLASIEGILSDFNSKHPLITSLISLLVILMFFLMQERKNQKTSKKNK